MYIPLFDRNPTEREKEKFMNSYWVRQLQQYQRLWNEAKDLVVKERTGAYPLWHFEIAKRDGKHKLLLTDTRPVPLYNEDLGNTVIRVDNTRPTASFGDTWKSIIHQPTGFGRQVDIITGKIQSDGQVNNPTHWANNPNIQERRSK